MLCLDFHLHIGLPRLALVLVDLVSPGLVKGVCRAFTGAQVNSILHKVGATLRPHTTLMKAGICGAALTPTRDFRSLSDLARRECQFSS